MMGASLIDIATDLWYATKQGLLLGIRMNPYARAERICWRSRVVLVPDCSQDPLEKAD